MKFGVSVWPFQWSPPYEDALKRIARLGFRQVELIAWNRAAFDEYYTPSRIAELNRLMQGEGLQLSEFVSTPGGLASLDAARRATAVEHFKRTVEAAQALGTSVVNSVVATPFDLRFPGMLTLPTAQEVRVELPAGLDWDAGYAAYVEGLRQCCAVCEAAGVRYALETHPYRWATTALSLLRLIEHVGSPALGVNLDPSHMFPCGDLPQVAVYMLGGRVFHTHFSDNDGHSNAHWRPGKGKIDWSATLTALRDVGYQGVLSIELEGVPGVATSSHPTAGPELDREYTESREYLTRLAGEIGVAFAHS